MTGPNLQRALRKLRRERAEAAERNLAQRIADALAACDAPASESLADIAAEPLDVRAYLMETTKDVRNA